MKNVDWIRAVDIDKPSLGRIYDYFLGGFYNFEVDREVARKVLESVPEDAIKGVWSFRAFMRRAVRNCVSAGITQFIDLGSGIPSRGNVHEVAEQANSASRTVYVDIEPAAVVHGRTMLEKNDNAVIVHADLREPETIFDAPETNQLIDLNQPVALTFGSVLHFIPDSDDLVGIIRRYAERVVSGSCLVISHCGEDVMRWRAGLDTYKEFASEVVPRSRAEVEALFTGFELIEPGVTWLEDAHPDPTGELFEPPTRFAYAGIARKP